MLIMWAQNVLTVYLDYLDKLQLEKHSPEQVGYTNAYTGPKAKTSRAQAIPVPTLIA